MGDEDRVIVDTNIIFSALISRNSRFRDVLLGSSTHRFYLCETVIVELFRHKEKLLRANPRLTPSEFADLYYGILRQVEIYKEVWVPEQHWAEAAELCRGVDADDTPHVAITLALNGVLWTGDEKLKRALAGKGFNRFFTPDP